MYSSRRSYTMGSGQSKEQERKQAGKTSPRKEHEQLSEKNIKQRSNQTTENTPRKQPPSQYDTTNQSSTYKDSLANQTQRYSYGKQTPNHKSTPRPQPTNQSPKQFRSTNQSPGQFRPTNQSPRQFRPTNQKSSFKSHPTVQFEDQLEWKKRKRNDQISFYDLEIEDYGKPVKDKSPRSGRQHSSSGIENGENSANRREGNIHEPEDSTSHTQKYMITPRLKKEQIETALRSSRVPETKVRHLAAHLSYMPNDDTATAQETELLSTEKILRKTISNDLDPILYGTRGKTNLNHYDQNTQGLAKKVSEMVQQINLDLQNCMDNLDGQAEEDDELEDEDFEYEYEKEKNQKGQKHTQTSGQKDNGLMTKNEKIVENKKSLTLSLQNGIRNMKTNYEILLDRYENLLKENQSIGSNNEKTQSTALAYQDENLKLEKRIKTLKQKLNDSLTGIEQANEIHYRLRAKIKETEIEKENFIQQNERLLNMTKGLTRELDKLQDETARTAVENLHLTKAFRRLQGPDKKVRKQIQRMECEMQEMRTQNRRLENEKGAIKATLQKLEATHEVTQVDRKFLAREKEALVKEMNNLKAEKRKLILSG